MCSFNQIFSEDGVDIQKEISPERDISDNWLCQRLVYLTANLYKRTFHQIRMSRYEKNNNVWKEFPKWQKRDGSKSLKNDIDKYLKRMYFIPTLKHLKKKNEFLWSSKGSGYRYGYISIRPWRCHRIQHVTLTEIDKTLWSIIFYPRSVLISNYDGWISFDPR